VKAHTKTLSVQKRIITLLLPAIIAAVPVLSQVNYASLNNGSLTGQDKRFAVNFPKYPALLKQFTLQFHAASASFFTSLPIKNNTTENKTGYQDKQDEKINLTPAESKIETDRENPEIIFKPTSFTYPENSKVDAGMAHYSASQLILYAKSLKQYAKKNGFDTSYAFIGNMGMLSNKKRFFVVNLATMEIEQSGLVSHGRGQGPSVYDKQYSNLNGSKCTSLGRYKIMNKYKGVYGEAYRMAGLDSSNQNAYSRNIVLHSMGCIPDNDGIMPACISEGCPAVSIQFLSSLRKIIDTRKKPVLLWIFDSNLEEAVMEEGTVNDKSGDIAVNEYHVCSLHSANNLGPEQNP
jgi:L,D-transpeptidase catalytic domain